MSWQAVQFVLEHSESYGATRLVLICLAERMNKGGANAHPGRKDLARRAKVDEATVRKALRWLREAGEIEPTGETPYGTRIYQLGAEWVARIRAEQESKGGGESPPLGGDRPLTGGEEPEWEATDPGQGRHARDPGEPPPEPPEPPSKSPGTENPGSRSPNQTPGKYLGGEPWDENWVPPFGDSEEVAA